MADVTPGAPVHLVKGDDEVLLRDAAHRVLEALTADLDPGLAVEEVGRDRFAPPDSSQTTIEPLVDAAQTPPFLTDRRVVVGRDIELFTKAAQVAPLVDYLADPLPTTSLVLVWSGGRIPKSLTEAVTASGGVVVDTNPGRKLAGWIDEQVAAAGLRLDRAAIDRLADWLGDDPQRLVGVLGTLSGSFGQGARLGVDDVEPFLGEAGGVPPWELTDAIDRGDIRRRARQAAPHDRGRRTPPAARSWRPCRTTTSGCCASTGPRSPVRRMRPQVLGLKGSTFPARKALTQTRKLGHDGVVRAIELLAEADLDLRGGKAWPDELVLEVLVARLARLAR